LRRQKCASVTFLCFFFHSRYLRKVICLIRLGVHREEVFVALRKAGIPIIYGPTDGFPYKVELKHEGWKNAEKLLRSGAKFSIMSDHPVTLQRNLFYSLRRLLRFGLSRAQAISKITREPAEIIGAQNIGEVRQAFKASLVV
jgi:imidazolonepropionase-like amidohydrolase